MVGFSLPEGMTYTFSDTENDTVSSDINNDWIFGNWGSDTFVYSSGDGRDTIVDYETGTSSTWYQSSGDQISIDIDGINSFDDLMGYGSEDGSNVVFDFGNGDELILSTTQLAALDQDAFTFF